MSLQSRKGYEAEAAFVGYLREHGWPHARRPPVGSHTDIGDVEGTPRLAWEIRNRIAHRIGAWCDEAAEICGHLGAEFGFLILKPNGIGPGKVSHWIAGMRLYQLTKLVVAAGLPARCWQVNTYTADLKALSGELAGRAYAIYNQRTGRNAPNWADLEDCHLSQLHALMRVDTLIDALHRAGYGDPAQPEGDSAA